MEGPTVICKGEFKVKTTHASSSWLIVTMGSHFHAMCQLLKSCQCSHALWIVCYLKLIPLILFVREIYLKLVDAKSLHDLILIYFVLNHLFL
jgi:hypothetical protein